MPTTQALQAVKEPEMGYGQLLSILLRRFLWFGGAVVGTLGIAVLWTLKEAPVYQSSMQLLVEPNYRQTVDITGQQANQSSPSQVDYATQLNLMRSREFVEQTVTQLLVDYPDFCAESDTQRDCIGDVEEVLSLTQITEDDVETGIFEARFRANDAEVVQAFLATLSEIYLSYNQEQQAERLEQGLTLVNQQIEEVQQNLAVSRQDLRRFRETENLIDPEQQALAAAAVLREFEQTQIEVTNQSLEVRAQYDALQEQIAADPQTALTASRLSQSARYQQLLNALQEAELELQQRLALYNDADPGVQDLQSQRSRRIELLQEEVRRVLGEVPAQLRLDEAGLLTEGQLGALDLELVSDLVQAEIQLRSLQARQTGLEQDIQQLQGELNEFPGLIAEYDRIQPEVDTQLESLTDLLQLRQALSNELAQGGFSWDMVEVPQVGEQIAPQPVTNIALGIVAGLFIGGALAFGREAIDNSVRTSDELQKQVNLPLLGVIPTIPKQSLVAAGADDDAPLLRQTFALGQYPPFRDAVDLIYKTIQLTSAQPLTSLMVTSALAGEGKSVLAIALALSAARSHQRVLLVDANLRHPSLQAYLGPAYAQPNGPSLADRSEREPFSRPPISVSLAGTLVDVLTAGKLPADPVRFLSSQSMRQVLANAAASYDFIVVDAPAILGFADGLQLASLCSASIMISRLDYTTQADLTEALTILSNVNTIGIVANKHRDRIRPEKMFIQNGFLETHENTLEAKKEFFEPTSKRINKNI